MKRVCLAQGSLISESNRHARSFGRELGYEKTFWFGSKGQVLFPHFIARQKHCDHRWDLRRAALQFDWETRTFPAWYHRGHARLSIVKKTHQPSFLSWEVYFESPLRSGHWQKKDLHGTGTSPTELFGDNRIHIQSSKNICDSHGCSTHHFTR